MQAARAAEPAPYESDERRPYDWQGERVSEDVELVMGVPSELGRFGEFGGRYRPRESIVPACDELDAAFDAAWADPAFRASATRRSSRDYAGRPTPVDRVRAGSPSTSACGCC